MAQTVIAASLTLDSSQATNSVKSFKTQLREATQNLVQIQEQFGDASAEALQAARSVAQLRDRIQDAREVSDLFNPAQRFQAFSNVLGVAANGVTALTGAMALFGDESKDVQAALLKVQGALALSQGLSALGNAAEDFQRFKAVAVDAFKAIKTAIGSTGIGLIVIGVGLLVTYFDDIKEALTGINSEQKKSLETTTKLADKEKEKLTHIDEQDNVLKMQGKTEKQILEIKEKQTIEVIRASQAQLDAQKLIQKAQIENAERNHKILASIIEFTSIPLLLITKSVDAILQKVGVNSQLTKGLMSGINSAANVIFDPAATKKKSDEDNKELQQGIDKLKNTYAGYQLSIKAINKEADEKEIARVKEKNAKLLEIEKKHNADMRAFREKFDDFLREKNNLEFAEQEADLDAAFNQEESIRQKKIADLQAVSEIEKQIGLSNLDAAGQQAAAALEALDRQTQGRLSHVKAGSDEEKAIFEDAERAKSKIAEIELNGRLSLTRSVLDQAADLLGKQSVAGKALAIASATISTYQSAVSSYNSLSGIPIVGPALGFVAAAVAIAAGLANIKKIASVQIPGKSSSSSTPGITSVSAPLTPQVGTTQLPQDQINQIGQAGNQTVKAFVVESDISESSERIQRLNRQARLGN